VAPRRDDQHDQDNRAKYRDGREIDMPMFHFRSLAAALQMT